VIHESYGSGGASSSSSYYPPPQYTNKPMPQDYNQAPPPYNPTYASPPPYSATTAGPPQYMAVNQYPQQQYLPQQKQQPPSQPQVYVQGGAGSYSPQQQQVVVVSAQMLGPSQNRIDAGLERLGPFDLDCECCLYTLYAVFCPCIVFGEAYSIAGQGSFCGLCCSYLGARCIDWIISGALLNFFNVSIPYYAFPVTGIYHASMRRKMMDYTGFYNYNHCCGDSFGASFFFTYFCDPCTLASERRFAVRYVNNTYTQNSQSVTVQTGNNIQMVPISQQMNQPVYTQPGQPVYAQPGQPVYAQKGAYNA